MDATQELELSKELIWLFYKEVDAMEEDTQEMYDVIFTPTMQARKMEIERLLRYRF